MQRPAVSGVGNSLRRLIASRAYAVQAPGGPRLQVFDRRHKWLQKERAAANADASRGVDYLRDEVAARLSERLLDINRNFEQVLDLGANACHIARALTLLPLSPPLPSETPPSPSETASDTQDGAPLPPTESTDSPPSSPPLISKISHLTAVDSSSTLLHRDASLPFNSVIPITRQVLDAEDALPYTPNTFDAVLSSLSMHWINDLPFVLSQVNTILKPDAPFIAAMFGGDSLYELRTSLQLADLERRGGVAGRTSPLADVRDMGGLLQSAGFKLLTVDVDDIIVDYPSIFELMQDLQAMGEQNAIIGREGPMSRDVLLSADSIYRALHGNEDGKTVPATFRLIYLIGWKEGPNQRQPEQRGSGQIDMRDVLGSGGGIGPQQ